MRTRRFTIFILCTAAALSAAECLFSADIAIPQQLSSLIKGDAIVITPQPILMSDTLALLCSTPSYIDKTNGEQKKLIDPHGNRYAVVFTNDKAAAPIRKGAAVYPEGSVVAKGKYQDAEATKLELITFMKKMATGYNRDHGDWEYGVIDSTGKLVESGKLQSCMACHDRYKATGNISRNYLRSAAAKTKSK